MSEQQRVGGPREEFIDVRVKSMDDRETIVTIGTNDTVSSLVSRGRAQLHITSGMQRIIYQGRVLQGDQTITQAGIQHGHAVHLVNRMPGDRNESPNVVGSNLERIFPPTGFMNGRISFETGPGFLPPPTSLPRVPNSINGNPVLSSLLADVVNTSSRALRLRNRQNAPAPDFMAAPFNFDPHCIIWKFDIIDANMFRDRARVEEIVKNVVRRVPFLEDDVKELIVFTWTRENEFEIQLPQIAPHIPSPALEKLDFLCFWTEYIKGFISKVTEPDGLVPMVQNILEMTRRRQTDDGLEHEERERTLVKLDDVIAHLELLSAQLSHMKDYERDRFKNNNTSEYRDRKIQEHPANGHNPRFMMRHALDVDMSAAMREFRSTRSKFNELEELMENLTDAGAAKFTKDIIPVGQEKDYRHQAVSIFYHYMQETRHKIAHITHLSSEIDISFLATSFPQRLLPQFAAQQITVPVGHPVTLRLVFDSEHRNGANVDIPITAIVEPPRRCSDVGDRVNGDWPYLPFNPPSVSRDAVVAPPRLMFEPRLRQQVESMPSPLREHMHHVTTRIVRRPGPDGLLVSVGNAPSVPVETQPPPTEAELAAQQAAALSDLRTMYGPNSIILPDNRLSQRLSANPNAVGPETELLHAVPQYLEPNELQRIARNIAIRFRTEALRRIATNLGARFRQESWDTRIENMPMCTLRECIALALELICASGNNINESKELMLALIRDEDVLIRAITESIKSLFSRGEFPTHLSRFILPRSEAASSRNDYEDIDNMDQAQADERESMIVRVPSDISQPQSGDLRAIRNMRNNRRARMEAQAASGASTSGASSSTGRGANTPPPGSTTAGGPMFTPEDMADIRAGRLPTRRRPQQPAATSSQAAPDSGSPHAQLSFTLTGTATSVSPTIRMTPPSTAGAGPSGGHAHGHSHNHGHSHGHGHGHGHSHQFVPTVTHAQMVVGPGDHATALSLLGGYMEPDIIRQFLEEELRSMPPPPTPSTSSAPNTTTSSPTHEVPLRSQLPRGRFTQDDVNVGGRVQREFFAGQRPSTSSEAAGASGPSQFARMMPSFIPSENTPLIAIDPFMVCGSRHCEVHRQQFHDAIPGFDRMTTESANPLPDLRIEIAELRPSLRKADRTKPDDSDYNYSIYKTHTGQVAFRDIEMFQKFVQTALRSLLSHSIDTDSLTSLNLYNVSGYPGANPHDLSTIVRQSISERSFQRFTGPSNSNLSRIEQRREQALEQLRVLNENQRLLQGNAAGNRDRRTSPPWMRHQAGGGGQPLNETAQRIQEIFGRNTPGQHFLLEPMISRDATDLVAYMNNRNNPSPPGIFGFLLGMLSRRFNRSDFAVITRRAQLGVLIMAHEGDIRESILEGLLDNRRNHTDTDLHVIVSRFANSLTFFEQFVRRYEIPETFTLPQVSRNIQTSWALMQIEIAVMKALFTLCMHRYTSREISTFVIRLFDHYLARTMLVFWIVSGRNVERRRELLCKISDYFATIRFSGQQNPGRPAFVESWNRVMDYWITTYHGMAVSEENNFARFMAAAARGTDWNDIRVDDPRAAHRTGSIRRETSDEDSSSENEEDGEDSAAVPPSGSNVNDNQNAVHRTWNQIRRLIQENPITIVSLVLCGWMWWRR